MPLEILETRDDWGPARSMGVRQRVAEHSRHGGRGKSVVSSQYVMQASVAGVMECGVRSEECRAETKPGAALGEPRR